MAITVKVSYLSLLVVFLLVSYIFVGRNFVHFLYGT